MQLVRTLVDQLDGRLDLVRNRGTKFSITFKRTTGKGVEINKMRKVA
jgi:two-component sensor histidine kinase